jgi:hypothetical protein
LQTIRDWVMRFNAEGPDGLIDRKAPGPEPRLNDGYSTALAAAIESGPIAAFHGVVRWHQADLCQWLWSRSLRSARKLTARPRHHAQAERGIEHFKKFPCHRAETAQDKGIERAAIEIWFADEARIGQKNKIIRRRARCTLRAILRMHIRR